MSQTHADQGDDGRNQELSSRTAVAFRTAKLQPASSIAAARTGARQRS